MKKRDEQVLNKDLSRYMREQKHLIEVKLNEEEQNLDELTWARLAEICHVEQSLMSYLKSGVVPSEDMMCRIAIGLHSPEIFSICGVGFTDALQQKLLFKAICDWDILTTQQKAALSKTLLGG